MRWVNSWFNLLKSHLGDGLFLFRQTSGRVAVHCRSHYVCLCLAVFSISLGFFLLISTLSSVYLAVFSISAFWSVFTFSSAFPCRTFLTQFTIALLYHIKSFNYCWHMSTMPQFKVTIAQKVCGSSECLCKTVRTAWSKVPLRIDQILTISSDALKLAKSTETRKIKTSFM